MSWPWSQSPKFSKILSSIPTSLSGRQKLIPWKFRFSYCSKTAFYHQSCGDFDLLSSSLKFSEVLDIPQGSFFNHKSVFTVLTDSTTGPKVHFCPFDPGRDLGRDLQIPKCHQFISMAFPVIPENLMQMWYLVPKIIH